MDFNAVLGIIKALGKESTMELVKSKWVQFCIGLAILLVSATPFVRAIRWW